MILAGQRWHDEPVACAGLLVIGDPHVGSRRPGRRRDADWPDAVLAKLERCVEIANKRNLAPILLGDLFDRAVEPDESLKIRLIRLFRKFRHMPIANVGNHDIRHTTLSDGDSLAVLGAADVLHVVARSGPVMDFRVGARRLGLGMTPYGQEIPRDVRGLFEADSVLWCTHHDIAFAGAYPRSIPPFAIEGCQLIVNGHVHATKKPVRTGPTLWTNPGNISRLSVDQIGHVPCAWVLGADSDLVPEPLPHAADVFDLTGRLVAAADGGAVAEAVQGAFAALLEAEASMDVTKSDDGSILADEIRARFAREDTPEAVRAIIEALFAEAVERRNGRRFSA